MRLLIITQAVDRTDPVLGFFLDWIALFARECDEVHVICLKEGEYDLPGNVTVHSLGKEAGASRIKYLVRFYWYLVTLHRRYDAVFVHMNPEYILLGGLWWRLWGKKIGLWYVHSSVTRILRFATKLTHLVFTTSPESFLIHSRKVQVMGHGIPVGLFSVPETTLRGHGGPHEEVQIMTIGRVSRTKRIGEMLLALDELYRRGTRFTFTIVGAPATESDVVYRDQLDTEIAQRPYAVVSTGPIAYRDLPHMLARADVFLNLSATESMDKAVLESFAAGVPVVSSNKAFRAVLEKYRLFCADTEPGTVADAIESYLRRTDREDVREGLRSYVEQQHSLSRLIPAIMHTYVRD
jgi:glycosyltransferase involved in cell wall biosynthesis